jgi:hypothetical protein
MKRLAIDYLRAFDAAAVFVASLKTDPELVYIGADESADVGVRHLSRAVGRHLQGGAAYWVNGLSNARKIAAAATEMLPTGEPRGELSFQRGTIEDAERAILSVAAQFHLTLTPYEQAVANAAGLATAIEKYLKSAKARGDLKFLNAEYNRQQEAAHRAGKPFISFPECIRRLKIALYQRIAAGGRLDIDNRTVAEIFGSSDS